MYKNGDKYEGDWANDLRHGLGTLWIYKGGKYVVRYNGEWREDQPTVSHPGHCFQGLREQCCQRPLEELFSGDILDAMMLRH